MVKLVTWKVGHSEGQCHHSISKIDDKMIYPCTSSADGLWIGLTSMG